jgi:hypothetical protein
MRRRNVLHAPVYSVCAVAALSLKRIRDFGAGDAMHAYTQRGCVASIHRTLRADSDNPGVSRVRKEPSNDPLQPVSQARCGPIERLIALGEAETQHLRVRFGGMER